MKRSELRRRTPLRAAKSERWACPDCQRECVGATCPTCLGPAEPILTARPPARSKRPRDPVPPHVRAAVYERSGMLCERCYADVATALHHVRLRSRGGGHTVENLVHLCAPDHAWAHANPALATAEGFMRPSWDGAA